MPSEYPGLEAKVRMLVEKDVAPMARRWKKELPGDVGFVVFMTHLGSEGGIAYVSSLQRHDVLRSLIEWIRVEGKKTYPELKEFFDYLHLATREPQDSDYDEEFVKKARKK
jgi:hypothetical protein